VAATAVRNSPGPLFTVRSRNLPRLPFRAVPYDFKERLQTNNYRPEYLNPAERQAILTRKPAREWSADLPATQDYQERVEKLAAPTDLKPGFYFLVASPEPNFGPNNNVVSFSAFWVSRLALVTRVHQGEGALEGFVLDALSGNPIEGAEVKAWYRTFNNVRGFTQPTRTNGNGHFRF